MAVILDFFTNIKSLLLGETVSKTLYRGNQRVMDLRVFSGLRGVSDSIPAGERMWNGLRCDAGAGRQVSLHLDNTLHVRGIAAILGQNVLVRCVTYIW